MMGVLGDEELCISITSSLNMSKRNEIVVSFFVLELSSWEIDK